MGFITEREILSYRSWVIKSDCVEMAVTHSGAQMAPVHFYIDTENPIQPYYISPWQGENLPFAAGRSEAILRGDFFCMPFGMDCIPYQNELHPKHGETASSLWSLVDCVDDATVKRLTLAMEMKARAGRVVREYSLVQGENVVYDCTTIHGCKGPMTWAHHAVVACAEEPGSLLISSSPIRIGMVYPFEFGDGAEGNYQALEIGAVFESLDQVPSIFKHGPLEDCSSYPARRGFSDLLQIANDPDSPTPAWTVAVNTVGGYLWFALKDVRSLPTTILWMENHGRHGAPWNGRNCALGLEDACTYFDRGIAESSRENMLSECGIKTFHQLDGDAYQIRYIQGAVKTPAGFGRVVKVEITDKEVYFIGAEGKRAVTKVQSGFLRGDKLR